MIDLHQKVVPGAIIWTPYLGRILVLNIIENRENKEILTDSVYLDEEGSMDALTQALFVPSDNYDVMEPASPELLAEWQNRLKLARRLQELRQEMDRLYNEVKRNVKASTSELAKKIGRTLQDAQKEIGDYDSH